MAFIPGTKIELVRDKIPRGGIRCVVFDFDGTLSLVRGGWMEIMISMSIDAIRSASRTSESERDLRVVVRNFVERLNGKPTIHQMHALADEVKKRGGKPSSDEAYKRQYHKILYEKIEERLAEIAKSKDAQEKYLVPGARATLELIKKKKIPLHLASGTEESGVKRECEALGILEFFQTVNAAPDAGGQFSKQEVFERLVREQGIQPSELLSFGDGFVETTVVRALGGIAVGMATDEERKVPVCPQKKKLLTKAGADLIAGDYKESKRLLEYLFKEE